jgi:large subunit ribosomal protein L4e
MTNSDIARIINSDEIQAALRPKKSRPTLQIRKKNPLKNLGFRIKLDPSVKRIRRKELIARELRQKKKAELLEAKRKGLPTKEKKAKKQKKIDNKKFVARLLSK